jgi:chromatin segregation and condensation protein Rec8/ScpA/Scc1 (kleisin family)
LFESAASRSEVICTFLALLELIRLKQLVCTQPEPFTEIEIRRADNVASVALTKDLDSDSTKPSIEETKS